MKVIRAIAGTLAGYLIFLVWTVSWFFTLTHHDPWLPASPAYIAATALFGIAISWIAGYAGAVIAWGSERGAGEAIAVLILVVSEWSWWESPGQAHWSQAVAIFLMGPAAMLGARLRAGRHRLRSAANRE